VPLGSFNPHSPQTKIIAALFENVLILAAAVFLVVAGLVTYGLVRYRAKKGSAAFGIEPAPSFGSRPIEIAWTVIPILILAGLFIVTVRAMARIDAPSEPGRAPDLVITGHQWWWDARYPNGVIAPSEIHIPAGRRLLAEVDSTDVIHDFWVPQLARKIDAVPGRPAYIWLEADAPGTYRGECSEFCGADHARMHFLVIAESEAEYSAWLQRESQPARMPPPAIFQQKCADCHAKAAKGPDLTHIASRQTLGAALSPNNPESLALWVEKPQSVKPGNRMPDQQLSRGEIAALSSYLGSLQ
jgi:cytochrome c oxidase subunit II